MRNSASEALSLILAILKPTSISNWRRLSVLADAAAVTTGAANHAYACTVPGGEYVELIELGVGVVVREHRTAYKTYSGSMLE